MNEQDMNARIYHEMVDFARKEIIPRLDFFDDGIYTASQLGNSKKHYYNAYGVDFPDMEISVGNFNCKIIGGENSDFPYYVFSKIAAFKKITKGVKEETFIAKRERNNTEFVAEISFVAPKDIKKIVNFVEKRKSMQYVAYSQVGIDIQNNVLMATTGFYGLVVDVDFEYSGDEEEKKRTFKIPKEMLKDAGGKKIHLTITKNANYNTYYVSDGTMTREMHNAVFPCLLKVFVWKDTSEMIFTYNIKNTKKMFKGETITIISSKGSRELKITDGDVNNTMFLDCPAAESFEMSFPLANFQMIASMWEQGQEVTMYIPNNDGILPVFEINDGSYRMVCSGKVENTGRPKITEDAA